MKKEVFEKLKERFKILAVDDDEQYLGIVYAILDGEGYNVVTASSGEKAIKIIQKENIDIVLLDFFMPKMTGEEVVREIQKYKEDIVIILQTGYSGEKPAIEMLESLDIQNYHNKEDGFDKLLISVASAVKYKDQQEQLRIQEEKLVVVGRLIDGLTQYLQNPIMCIAGIQENLRQLIDEYKISIYDPDVNKEDHQQIHLEMEKWNNEIMSNLTYFSEVMETLRLQAREDNIEQIFEVHSLAEKLNFLLKVKLREKHSRLNVKIMAKTIEIKGLISNMACVLVEWLMVAIDSMYQGEEIDLIIEKSKNGQDVEFEIRWNGVGDLDEKEYQTANVILMRTLKGTDMSVEHIGNTTKVLISVPYVKYVR